MSRIGKKEIVIPTGVKVELESGNKVSIIGPKGTLVKAIDRDMKIIVDNDRLLVECPTNHIRHKALHGLSRMLLYNMILGVSQGFEKKLELIGVGYRASVQGQLLDLSLGYSHNIIFELPTEVKATVQQEKGQNLIITLQAADNQLLGQVAAKIRMLRKPEPYKGKGIKYVGEILRRKAGKAKSSGK